MESILIIIWTYTITALCIVTTIIFFCLLSEKIRKKRTPGGVISVAKSLPILLLIKMLRGPLLGQIQNPWAPISIQLQLNAIIAIMRFGCGMGLTNDALGVACTICALITDEGFGVEVAMRIAENATCITIRTNTTCGAPRKVSAEDCLWVMACHLVFFLCDPCGREGR